LYYENDISPSNDKSFVFQDYAYHCVTQSNSSKARKERLIIFQKLFSNKEDVFNDYQKNVIEYYKQDENDLREEIDGYLLINTDDIED